MCPLFTRLNAKINSYSINLELEKNISQQNNVNGRKYARSMLNGVTYLALHLKYNVEFDSTWGENSLDCLGLRVFQTR